MHLIIEFESYKSSFATKKSQSFFIYPKSQITRRVFHSLNLFHTQFRFYLCSQQIGLSVLNAQPHNNFSRKRRIQTQKKEGDIEEELEKKRQIGIREEE